MFNLPVSDIQGDVALVIPETITFTREGGPQSTITMKPDLLTCKYVRDWMMKKQIEFATKLPTVIPTAAAAEKM
ncbi:unnamed protein product [Haemonchus placei]|uniref:Uncharacterized protein n=1 Tax=Haemonchus placei TaxID=6290 RepID=A0A3P7WTY8_HAEPC|nr:unnamed protein product [Haemonchus placei]